MSVCSSGCAFEFTQNRFVVEVQSSSSQEPQKIIVSPLSYRSMYVSVNHNLFICLGHGILVRGGSS